MKRRNFLISPPALALGAAAAPALALAAPAIISPQARAAATYSRDQIALAEARVMRAKVGML